MNRPVLPPRSPWPGGVPKECERRVPEVTAPVAVLSSSRGLSQPLALTDPYVNLSVLTAPVVLVTRLAPSKRFLQSTASTLTENVLHDHAVSPRAMMMSNTLT